MNLPLVIANLLTLLAFVVHTFVGDKELHLIHPNQSDKAGIKLQVWTMSRCGWHWISFDLLAASVLLTMINWTTYITHEKVILELLSLYFAGYGLFWLVTILISKRFFRDWLYLGQWMLLWVISGLIYFG